MISCAVRRLHVSITSIGLLDRKELKDRTFSIEISIGEIYEILSAQASSTLHLF